VAEAAQAREQAREILSQRRFQEPELPRPFEHPLQWLGDRLEDVGDWFLDAFDGVDGALPGGAWVLWLLLALGAVAAGALVARAAVRRRAVAGLVRAAAGKGEPAADPAAIEREADAAERDGDYERAVRLRFRAGVVRLERERVLEPGGLRTTGEIAHALHSPAFDALGTDFDAIAYGGRPAGEDDARAARDGWQAVLAP
jgi:uncharacterized protein DUF4129